MSLQQVDIGGVLRTVRFPDDPGIAGRFGLVWVARFVDETSGLPVPGPVRLKTSRSELRPVSGRDGFAGLVAVPTSVYPDLVATPVPIDIEAEADGFRPLTLSDTLTAAPDHPAGFEPAGPAAPVPMQPVAVGLAGRVTRETMTGPVAVPAADVTVTGTWFTQPPLGMVQPILPAELAEIRPALAEEAITGTTVRRIGVAPTGTATTLRNSAPAGALDLVLENRGGLLAGHLLELSPGDDARAEMVRIASSAPLPPSPFGGVVTLVHPLGHAHVAGSVVARRTVAGAGPPRALARDGLPGSRTLFLDNDGGLFTTGWLRVGTGASAQIRRARPYATQTDAEGYFRLPPIHRVARVFLEVDDGITALVDYAWSPARDGPLDRLDLRLETP